MLGWFRKYVRKIGIFGVEVEFHPPPTDTSTPKPEPSNANVQRPEERSPSQKFAEEEPKHLHNKQENSMALRKCLEPDCGNMVSTMASVCPKCGCPTDASTVIATDLDDLFPSTGSLEDRIRSRPEVRRLLNNENWRPTAEAAIKELVLGQRCSDDSRRATATWKQIKSVVEEERRAQAK